MPRHSPRHLQRAINHSLCFGAYLDGQQVAFARVITDKGNLSVISPTSSCCPNIAGTAVTARPWWQPSSPTRAAGLRRLSLATSDAHGLYAGFGFVPPRSPGSLMEILRPRIYRRP